MNRFLLPLYQGDAFQPGSTDVGDVSWQCPTAQIHVAAWPNGCPGHSWQNVSCDRTSIGHKAAVHAGKVLCAIRPRIELLRKRFIDAKLPHAFLLDIVLTETAGLEVKP